MSPERSVTYVSERTFSNLQSSQGPKMRTPGNAPGGQFHFHAALLSSDLMEAPSRTDGEMPAKPARGLHKRIYILSDADFTLILRGFTKAPNWHD